MIDDLGRVLTLYNFTPSPVGWNSGLLWLLTLNGVWQECAPSLWWVMDRSALRRLLM